jgi:hypothetical protein
MESRAKVPEPMPRLLQGVAVAVVLVTWYVTISFNSAGRVMRNAPAEILDSACCQNWRDNFFFSAFMHKFLGLHRSIIEKKNIMTFGLC